jgi:hypothetical protein
VARRSNSNGGFAGHRPAGSIEMMPIATLEQEAVSFRVAGPHAIALQRFKSGQVGMTCDCAESVGQGWCRHRLEILCGRYGTILESSEPLERSIKQIVSGTLLADDAGKVDLLLKAFHASLAAFDANRPADIVGDNLATFTELVSDLAASSGDLEDAIGRLRRRLEVNKMLARSANAHPAVADSR